MVKCRPNSATRIILALPRKEGLGFRGWIKRAEEFERAHPTGLDLPKMLSRR
jgi:hypothetical protein